MKQRILLFLCLTLFLGGTSLRAQKSTAGNRVKAIVYYFHPTERCPIDQSIEDNTRKLIRTDFAREVKEGILEFRVLNTDEKSSEKIVSQFEINAQALYVVKYRNGKETRTDLTEFAFSNSQHNPVKFKAELKQTILNSLK